MFNFVGTNVLSQTTEEFRADITFSMKQSFVKGIKRNE
jgi:hypothetical protein